MQKAVKTLGLEAQVHQSSDPMLLDGAELRAPAMHSLGFQPQDAAGEVWAVESVLKDSWADVFGLREADRILWVNGRPTSDASWSEVLRWSRDGPVTLNFGRSSACPVLSTPLSQLSSIMKYCQVHCPRKQRTIRKEGGVLCAFAASGLALTQTGRSVLAESGPTPAPWQ